MYKFNVNKIFQTTIVNPVNLKGIGLHTGLESRIKIAQLRLIAELYLKDRY